MFDIRVFNALATQTSIKIGQISFNVTTPYRPLAEPTAAPAATPISIAESLRLHPSQIICNQNSSPASRGALLIL
jgi:hypothetical protein